MFGVDLYPTPIEFIKSEMLTGIDIENKIILEPSAGTGNIVKALNESGVKQVIACEIDERLRKIIESDCKIIESDFFNLTSDKISHIDAIIMNPPFSKDVKHILHAYNIAPPGCDIVALCNKASIKNTFSGERKELAAIIQNSGSVQDMGSPFKNSERPTEVEVCIIRLKKAGVNDYENEFDGFFMEEDDENREIEGVLKYDFIRDVVNRYIQSIKIFDKQIETAKELNKVLFFHTPKICVSITEDNAPTTRAEFKKEAQKSAWQFIISKMGMEKMATKKLREDINKFVEKQTHLPFTMKNIYRMIEIVIGTNEARMNTALEEVFDKVTRHYDENRYNVEGWKTNSHYLLNEKFILPYMTEVNYEGKMGWMASGNAEIVNDFIKALCYLTGTNYNTLQFPYFSDLIQRYDRIKMQSLKELPPLEFGTWYDWNFFKIKGFKKGTVHFKFKEQKVWALFNQRISKIKGYPLYEHKEQTYKEPERKSSNQEFEVLQTIKIK